MSSFKEFYEENKGSFKPKKDEELQLKDACWDGYEAVGFKMKDGKRVPNCVPIKKNESFASFYNNKEEKQLDEEMLNEDAISIVMATLALPSVLAVMAWAGSLIFLSYAKGVSFIAGKVIRMWKKAFSDIKDFITPGNVNKVVKDISRDPKTQDQARKTERNKRAFEAELKEVYSAIEDHDFDKAKEEFGKSPKYIQNNPDVYKVIIAEISKALKEPPIYVQSPGNETYQAIKKIINIRVAKAAAYATKMTMERNLKNSASTSTEPETEQKDKETQEQEDLGL